VPISFDEIALRQKCFAEVLVRAAMSRVEYQGLLVMSHRLIELPQTPISVAEVVQIIGVAVIAQHWGCKRLDGTDPVIGNDRPLACGEIDRAPPNLRSPPTNRSMSRSARLPLLTAAIRVARIMIVVPLASYFLARKSERNLQQFR
jgi:hypothetical protein